jgi:hypothetical protein
MMTARSEPDIFEHEFFPKVVVFGKWFDGGAWLQKCGGMKSSVVEKADRASVQTELVWLLLASFCTLTITALDLSIFDTISRSRNTHM